MDMIPLTPERKAQLDDYAERHGCDPAVALDKALANYLALERRDFEQAVEGVLEGYEDVKAGRTRDAAIFLDELRRKYGFPG